LDGLIVRRLTIVLIAITLSIVGFFGTVILASESGEVITLRTSSGDSEQHSTRLWVVDYAGAEWTRTGHPEKGWFLRILANPVVELERKGQSSPRTAVPVSERAVAQGVNRAYKEKYGIADWIVALSGDASRRVVIRLDQTEP
jgi:hypothetical protein